MRVQDDAVITTRLAIEASAQAPTERVADALQDVINGGPGLREWVDDKSATPADLDALTQPDEQAWASERRAFLHY